MKAKELIKVLEQHPELEVGLFELGKYGDNIPMLPIHSSEYCLPDDNDDSNGFIAINFLTNSPI